MRKSTAYIIVGLSIVIGLAFFGSVNAAETEHDFNLKLFNSNLDELNEVTLIGSEFSGMTDFSLVDFGGDGVNEIVVSVGYQNPPKVKVFRMDESLINEWQPYPAGYKGRINLAVADLNDDGKEEVVTAPGEGGGPHIRIFNGQGASVFTESGFFAAEEGYRLGTEIALGDVNGDGQQEIIVSMIGDNKNLIKVFDVLGNQLYDTIEFEAKQYNEPIKITSFDMDQDGQAEIIAAASMGNEPLVRVMDMYGNIKSQFMAYASTFSGGFDVAAGVFDGQSEPYIVTSAGYGGGPHVRIYNLHGEYQVNPTFFAYQQDFRGGVNVDLDNKNGSLQIATLPQTSLMGSELTRFGKVIKVDISEQKLYAYEKGRLVKEFYISSGKYGFDTPIGEFSVYRKTEKARMSWNYGPDNPNNYDLPNVPHILAFYGAYTIHGAYWHNNWGYRMSHGCVNVDLVNAEWIYNWTPVGTPVIIVP